MWAYLLWGISDKKYKTGHLKSVAREVAALLNGQNLINTGKNNQTSSVSLVPQEEHLLKLKELIFVYLKLVKHR